MAKDFFISYHSSDRPWAEWIAWVLEENGYTTRLRHWDFRPDGNIILNLHMAASPGKQQIIVLISEQYLKTQAPIGEWPDDFNKRLQAASFRLIPMLIEDCQLTGALTTCPTVILSNKTETEAEREVFSGIKNDLGKGFSDSKIALEVPTGSGKTKNAFSFLLQQKTASSHENFANTLGNQFKLLRRTQTVQGYLDRLSDELGLEMMQIPAGDFVMGSPDNELERQDREGPQHKVSLASFFMGKYPITQFQWRFVAGLSPVNLRLNLNPARFEVDTHPVEQISWPEAVEFCDRLSLHTGRPYRLPTEAEWEYACRANTTTPFHFGETITTALANYNGADEQHGTYGRGPTGENRQTTTSVYQFGIANAFGLCDMHGDLWEWCQDPWQSTYGDDSLKRKIKAAPEPDQSTHRLARGGSWYTTPQRCRSASRIHFEPESRHADVGFRVVCSFGE
jgi:formylglycine-generating enzyme required for sulfatase activity